MSTRQIVTTSLLASIMIVLTCLIVIPIGINGYINLSDLLIMLLSQYLGMFDLFFVAGIACALADIFLGYSQYAIVTLITKSLEAFIMYYLYKNHIIKFRPLIYTIGAFVMLIGYALGDAILASDISVMLASIIANMSQAIICIIAASLLCKPFEMIGRKLNESK